MSGNPYLYLARHPRLAARKVSERLGLSDRTTNLADEADRLKRALRDVNQRLLELGAGSPTGRSSVLFDYPKAKIRLSVRAPRRRGKAAISEPFTIDWLERELRADDVLYDIGANVGAYSLIAAGIGDPALRIVAFEPAAETFGVLCENIVLNDAADRIIPLPVVLGAETGLGLFRYRELWPGASLHDSARKAADDDFVYSQPVLQFELDDLVRQFTLPPPTLIKLDVDGAEAAVLQGAPETLASGTLRSLMVEMELGDVEVPARLQEAGFTRVETHPKRNVEYGVFER